MEVDVFFSLKEKPSCLQIAFFLSKEIEEGQ